MAKVSSSRDQASSSTALPKDKEVTVRAAVATRPLEDTETLSPVTEDRARDTVNRWAMVSKLATASK